MSSLSGNQKLPLFFPPHQFSPRFGDQFFTVVLTNYVLQNNSTTSTRLTTDLTTSANATSNSSNNATICCEPALFVKYVIEIRRGSKTWSVSRRYSDFFALHNDLSNIPTSSSGNFKLPNLPPRTWFPVLYDEEFLLGRKLLLEQYVHELLTNLGKDRQLLPKALLTFMEFGDVEAGKQ